MPAAAVGDAAAASNSMQAPTPTGSDDAASDAGSSISADLPEIASFDHFLTSDSLSIPLPADTTPRAELSDVLTLSASCALNEDSADLLMLDRLAGTWQLEDELGPMDRRTAMAKLKEARSRILALEQQLARQALDISCLQAENARLKV